MLKCWVIEMFWSQIWWTLVEYSGTLECESMAGGCEQEDGEKVWEW